MTPARTAQSFPPAARLHSPAQFAPALKGRRIGREDWLILSAARALPREAAPPEPCARLGMVIAKRYAKRAVTRNAIKRVLREAFRQQQTTLPPRDYVFRLHGHVPPQSLTQVKVCARAQADALLLQARQRLG